MSKCRIHTDRDADGTCAVCGQFFCEECLVPVRGTHICKDCVGDLIVSDDESAKKPAPPSPPLKCYSIYVGLALILGGIGAHNFYRGKTSAGAFALMFSVVTSVITTAASLPPLGLILAGIVAFFEAFSTTDGYGRDMV